LLRHSEEQPLGMAGLKKYLPCVIILWAVTLIVSGLGKLSDIKGYLIVRKEHGE